MVYLITTIDGFKGNAYLMKLWVTLEGHYGTPYRESHSQSFPIHLHDFKSTQPLHLQNDVYVT